MRHHGREGAPRRHFSVSGAAEGVRTSALSALAVQGVREFTRADYQHAAGVSQSTAIADLDDLVTKRIVRRLRRGATTSYAFARARSDRRGRPRDWTPERIESELAQLCQGRTQWPTIRDFDTAGNGALYLAVGHYGGVDIGPSAWGCRAAIASSSPAASATPPARS